MGTFLKLKFSTVLLPNKLGQNEGLAEPLIWVVYSDSPYWFSNLLTGTEPDLTALNNIIPLSVLLWLTVTAHDLLTRFAPVHNTATWCSSGREMTVE